MKEGRPKFRRMNKEQVCAKEPKIMVWLAFWLWGISQHIGTNWFSIKPRCVPKVVYT